MSDTNNNDPIADTTKKIHDGIDFNSSLPVDAKDALHDIADAAGKLAHGAADAGRDVAETAALVALETTDQIQHRYARQARAITIPTVSSLAILSVLLIVSRRRK